MSFRSSYGSHTASPSSPFSSSVQVEVTFNEPVVFAGQSLGAIITFRNTQKPSSRNLHHLQSLDLTHSLQHPGTNKNASNSDPPAGSTTTVDSPPTTASKSISASETTPLPSSATTYTASPQTLPSPLSSSSASIDRPLRPSPINTNISNAQIQPSPLSSTSTVSSSISGSDTSSVPIILTEPASPLATTPIGKAFNNLSISTPLPSSTSSSEPTKDTNNSYNQVQNSENNSNSSSWEIPGRRLSSQIANTFRDFYFSNNASSPDVHRTNTVSTSATNSNPSGMLSPSSASHLRVSSSGTNNPLGAQPGNATSGRPLMRSGSQRVPSSRGMHGGNAGSSSSILSPISPNDGVSYQSLLMGYAQVQGYYVLDEELIDIDEFSHVKTQGVVVNNSGGIAYGPSQGGGLLQGLASGLGSLFQIRDNFGNTVSGNNSGSNTPSGDSSPDRIGLSRTLSRGRARSPAARGLGGSGIGSSSSSSSLSKDNAIPIFSTPQSLLFVDLKLEPGESKTFYYKLQLPKTLPPSCRAKSIRIHYNLVIGTQKLSGLGGGGRPQPKTTFVPFRIFPFVDRFGQQYTHDLKNPIVLQKDLSLVVQIPPDCFSGTPYESKMSILEYVTKMESKTSISQKVATERRDSFYSYLELLLDEVNSPKSKKNEGGTYNTSNNNSSSNLAPPQTPITPLFSSSRLSRLDWVEDYSTQENIDYFTRFQQVQPPAKPLKARFDIGRAGKRIATVTLSKAVYRVGENIIFIVDFSDAALKCFHVTASLETEETISSCVLKQFKNYHYNDTQNLDAANGSSNNHNDPNNDTNSHNTQQQNHNNNDQHKLPVVDTTGLTRRIYSQATMPTYSISKSTFEFTIPATATPQFNTSEISFKWVLKLDFITSPASAPPLQFSTPVIPPSVPPPRSSSTIPRSDEANDANTSTSSNLTLPQNSSGPRVSTDGESLDATTPERNTAETHLSDEERQQHQQHNHHHSHHRHPSTSSTITRSLQSSTIDPFDLPDDPHSSLEIVHLSDYGLIAVAKETIACESFHCKIPLVVIPTNQDITALLQHSIAPTRSWQL